MSEIGPADMSASSGFEITPRSVADLLFTRRPRIWVVSHFGFLAGRDPHNLDRVADHVGGAVLASRTFKHQPRSPLLASYAISPFSMIRKLTNEGLPGDKARKRALAWTTAASISGAYRSCRCSRCSSER